MLKKSVCTYCGVGCDIEAVVQNNEIKEIRANKDGIVSEGKLCIKGKYGYDFVKSSNRLPPVKIKKSFIDSHELFLPKDLKQKLQAYSVDDGYIYPSLELGYELAAWKIKHVFKSNSRDSFCAIGGARSSCENSYIFQKFTRNTIKSPHIDNCARVCHAPSLKGMRGVIGEGASTNPFWDIKNSEFLLIFGSNTTEAHPIVANKIINNIQTKKSNIALFDVRDINLSKKAKYNCIIPFEANLLVANMIAYEIVKDELYNKEFIEKRTKDFETYKEELLNDPYANPEFFQKIKGYEYLTDMIKNIAYEYATKKSMILWGLGVTEHIDGSYSVAAFCNLAILTGNIGKNGTGLLPLRGQNNVQGSCDMGCLPYYNPDYEQPLVEGKKTPDMINSMLAGEIKILFNMGEDISHIHPNQNKIQEALKKLDLIIVNELFDNDITKYADIIFGVKSAYEKTGIYINAERRLHLAQPLVENFLPDDWEVIQGIENYLDGKFDYKSSKDIWEEVRKVAQKRFSGASYEWLEKERLNGLQWPVSEKSDTAILHTKEFRTKDGLGHFKYKKWFLRGMIKELIDKSKFDDFYLTTGRVIAHYNNSNQTSKSYKLQSKYKEDIVLVSFDDEKIVHGKQYITLVSKYGKSAPLKFKLSKNIKKGTLFVTFHYAKSKINFLFGDEADELTKTARFKSIKVKIE